MDWLQFIASVIGHLAWPAVIIVLIIVLRKRLGALADRLQEFSFGGAKITLEKSLQEGATIIEKILTGSVSTFHNSKRRIPRHFLSHRAGPASK